MERPILFSERMVAAILAGTKTQTRRIVKPPWELSGDFLTHPIGNDRFCGYKCPYGKMGDQLWVRESWEPVQISMGIFGVKYKDGTIQKTSHTVELAHAWGDVYHPAKAGKWRPSIHMPRWASRLTLEVTVTGFARLQEITEEDAIAEGAPAIPRLDGSDPRFHRQSFAGLWDTINGDRPGCAWEDNPLVWVVGFKRVPNG